MVELTKELSLSDGIKSAHDKACRLDKEILFSYSFRFEIYDLLPILTLPVDKNNFRFYWEQPSKGFSFAGLGSVIEFQDYEAVRSKIVYNNIKQVMSDAISISDSILVGPRIVGGYAFNQYKGDDNTWKDFPRTKFILPECLGSLTDDGSWLTISKMVKPNEKLVYLEKQMIQRKNYYEKRLPVILPPISRVEVDKSENKPDQETYNKTINSILEKINPSILEKVVISRSKDVRIGKNFSCVSAIQVLRNAYPKCASFFFSLPNDMFFFGSTPERLIALKNGFIQTEALAGTIARGNSMEEDRILSNSLLMSKKEREEHNFVVEQIIRKLELKISNIKFSSNPEILRLKNVQHLKTPISGILKNNEHILELVDLLHPTSAVAGTPTDSAMNLITEMESHDRGWYSGPIGWIDRYGDGEFYVALRSALVNNEKAHVFAGGGIVSKSHPRKEWEETELKLQPIISALSGGQI